jgi:hypothetical protein
MYKYRYYADAVEKALGPKVLKVIRHSKLRKYHWYVGNERGPKASNSSYCIRLKNLILVGIFAAYEVRRTKVIT